MCKCIKGLIKFIVGIINGLIMAVGIILAVGGGIILWGAKTLLPKILGEISNLEKLLSDMGVQDVKETISSFQNAIVNQGKTFGIMFLVVGLILIALSICIYVAICCVGIRCVLYVIIALTTAFLVALIVVAIVYGANGKQKLIVAIETELQNFLNKYKSVWSSQFESVIINFIQYQYHCCGINSYKDYETVAWNRTVTSNNEFPQSCCKDIKKTDCTPDGENYKEIGCFEKVKPEIDKVLTWIFGSLYFIIVILALIDIVVIMFTCRETDTKV